MPLSRTASAIQAIRSYCPRSVIAKGFKPAAVLVPIQERAGEHYLTLIERAATLRSHGGEIAFPGGAVTAEDRDTLAAALRECQEEIGIDPENAQIIGQLDQVTVVGSRYLVTPFVGILRPPFTVSPNKQEVNSVISIPVSALLLIVLRQSSKRMEEHASFITFATKPWISGALRREFSNSCLNWPMGFGQTANWLSLNSTF